MSNTIIQTEIDGAEYLATTPHLPGASARSASASDAVTLLIERLRRMFAGGPVAWIDDPEEVKCSERITITVSGLWPRDIIETPPAVELSATEERTERDG